MTRRQSEFAGLLPRLPIEELLGITKIMGIGLVCGEDENGEKLVKDGEIIIQEMFDKFSTYDKTRQKNLLRIMRAAAKK